ncbi:hypothetical protein EV360DRAFT_68284 [Lentinula raphanica]|nr:hypothetical protein EV360DRAFT_68284 [Lentinula raphanica]
MPEWWQNRAKYFQGDKSTFSALYWNEPLDDSHTTNYVTRVDDNPQEKKFRCYYPGCPKQMEETFCSSRSRDDHFMGVHLGTQYKCTVLGCDKRPYKSENAFRRHLRRDHKVTGPLPQLVAAARV